MNIDRIEQTLIRYENGKTAPSRLSAEASRGKITLDLQTPETSVTLSGLSLETISEIATFLSEIVQDAETWETVPEPEEGSQEIQEEATNG